MKTLFLSVRVDDLYAMHPYVYHAGHPEGCRDLHAVQAVIVDVCCRFLLIIEWSIQKLKINLNNYEIFSKTTQKQWNGNAFYLSFLSPGKRH